jgi:hypothetical protein
MKVRSNMVGWGAGAVLVVAATFGVAAAQQEEAAGQDTGVDLTTQRDVNLSPAEIEAKLNEYLPQMEQSATTVRRQLEQARAARDVVKVLCLNDKLNQIDVAIRSASDRAGILRNAIAQNDVDRSRHEYQIVAVLHERVTDLAAEANQCIGEETGFIGESSVVVSIDPTIPDDPSELPPDLVISIPPTASSPIQ